MAKGDELIKYITERVVDYIETPKDIRQSRTPVKVKESWSSKWFGMIPISLGIWWGRLASKPSYEKKTGARHVKK
ncbi:hypothetical protein D3C77_546200 [compost metagenome]